MARGEIRYRLVADASGLEAGLARGAGALKSWASAGAGFTAAFTAGLAAVTAAAAGATAAVLKFTDTGGKLADLSAKSGIAADSLQRLGYAARLVGADQDQVAQAAVKLSKAIVDQNPAIAKLGLSYQTLRTLKPEEQFAEVASAINRLGTDTEKSAAAMDVFGKSGAELLPLIKSDMAAAADEAQRLGFVLDNETIAAADSLGDAFDKVGMAMENVAIQFGAAIGTTGGFQEAVDDAVEVLADLGKWVADHRDEIHGFFSLVRMSIEGARDTARDLIGWIKQLPGAGAVGGWLAQQGQIAGRGRDVDAGRVSLSTIAVNPYTSEAARADAEKSAREWAKEFKKRAGDYITDGRDLGASFAAAGEFWAQRAAEGFQEAWDRYGMSGGLDISDQANALLYGTDFTNVAQITADTLDWRDAVAGVGDAFAQVGQIAGGVLGGIFSLAGRLISVFQSVGKGLGSILSGGAAVSGLVGQVAGGGAGIGSGLGAIAGPMILKSIGSVLAPGIGTAVGAVAGGLLGKLFGGLFGGKDKPKIVPPTWEETFAKAEAAVSEFGLGAARGIQGLLGTAGSRRPEAQAFVDKQLGRATGAMGAIGGLDITSAAGAAAQATIFTTTFWAVVKEQGLVAGVDALAAPFAALKEKLAAGGFDVDALLGGVGGLFDAVEGPARAALEAADGLNQALQGVALAGYLTQDSFNAFGQAAQDAFNQASAAGLGDQQALQAIAPLLANIEEASRSYGLTIDANTQALLDQARNAGIAFPVDPIERAALAMERVAQHLERIYGLSENVGQSLSGWPTPGSGGVPSYHNPEGYASGGYIPPTPGGRVIRVAEGGEGEYVVPASQMRGGGDLPPMTFVLPGDGGDARSMFRRLIEGLRRNEQFVVSEITRAQIQQGQIPA